MMVDIVVAVRLVTVAVPQIRDVQGKELASIKR
jgi:hypothetical protein